MAPASPVPSEEPVRDPATGGRRPGAEARWRRELQPLGVADPLRWLARGSRDLRAAPLHSLFFGTCFWAMALTLGAVFRNMPEYTLSFISGCFLVGPFLAMGLYEISRRHEAGQPQSLGDALTCWSSNLGSMGLLVLLMLLLELLWGRASLVVFAVFFDTGMPSTAGVMEAVFNPRNWEFVAAYLAVGGVFAALVYATCVVSLPMILDRDTDAISAGLASFELVTGRPLVLLTWAALIIALVLAALWLPWACGLLVVGPWLGHATWHAYRGCFNWVPAAPDLP